MPGICEIYTLIDIECTNYLKNAVIQDSVSDDIAGVYKFCSRSVERMRVWLDVLLSSAVSIMMLVR